MVAVCLRADVSYFLCFTRKRDDVPFLRATREIGDVCTQAKWLFSQAYLTHTRILHHMGQETVLWRGPFTAFTEQQNDK